MTSGFREDLFTDDAQRPKSDRRASTDSTLNTERRSRRRVADSRTGLTAPFKVRLMFLTATVVKKLIKGTFLATLLLAAQEGGKPLNEAMWILVGATLTTVIDAYATHLSARSYGDLRAYLHSLWV